MRQAERDAGKRPGLTSLERERLTELERENRELRRANEIPCAILHKPAVLFLGEPTASACSRSPTGALRRPK